jgi:predicted negative regulator of RcsB-dependent stress response
MNEVFENNTAVTKLRNFYVKYQKLIIAIFILLAFLISAYLVNLQIEKKNNEQAAEIYNKWIAQEINTEEGKNASNEIFQELTNSFPSSGYSMIALLKKATLEAKAGNLDISYEKFNQLKEMSDGFGGNKLFNKIARINLARILYANEEFDKALGFLDIYTGSTDALIHELIGDILSKQDKKDLAIEQYDLAKQKYSSEASISIVSMKISNLAI